MEVKFKAGDRVTFEANNGHEKRKYIGEIKSGYTADALYSPSIVNRYWVNYGNGFLIDLPEKRLTRFFNPFELWA